MGPFWSRQDPGGPHVGPMNFAFWDPNNDHVVIIICVYFIKKAYVFSSGKMQSRFSSNDRIEVYPSIIMFDAKFPTNGAF